MFVSHNLSAVENLCDRALLLDHGRVITSGAPKAVIAEYEQLRLALPPTANVVHENNGLATINSVSFLDTVGQKTMTFSTGNPFRMAIEIVAQNPLEDVVVDVYFYSVFGNLHTHFSTDGEELHLKPGAGVVEFSCAEISLGEAAYNVEVALRSRNGSFNEYIDYKRAGVINVGPSSPAR